MKRFGIEEIKLLQIDTNYLNNIMESICLVEFDPQLVDDTTLNIHANFIIIEIILALQNDFIDDRTANHLINKVDALCDSVDMLTRERIIEKLNIEIVQDELRTPHFHKIAIMCDEIYVDY